MAFNGTTFEATFPLNGTIISRDMGRMIGVGGCGTKRLVAAVKSRFPNCRPFVRGDRTSGTFKLSAKGSDGEKAVRFLASELQKEWDWVSGKSEECPHSHEWVAAYNWDIEMKHIIGKGGEGIKRLQEKGGFILHKERNGRNWFLVEGTDSAMVSRMVLKLKERKDQLIRDQRAPRRVQVDLSRPVTQDQAPPADTNSFGALEEDSSDSSDDEENLKDMTAGQKAAEDEIRRHLQSNQLRGRGSVRNIGTEMHEARCAIAEKRGVEPFQVSDREVNEFLRQVADEEDLEMARRQPLAQKEVDTRSTEDFPDTLSKGDEGGVKLEVRSLGAWGAGAPQEKKISAKPPAPPMIPTKLESQKQAIADAFRSPPSKSERQKQAHAIASSLCGPNLERQFAERVPPRPTLARTMTTGVPAGSAFDGTPPADDCWPQPEFDGEWGDSDVDEF